MSAFRHIIHNRCFYFNIKNYHLSHKFITRLSICKPKNGSILSICKNTFWIKMVQSYPKKTSKLVQFTLKQTSKMVQSMSLDALVPPSKQRDLFNNQNALPYFSQIAICLQKKVQRVFNLNKSRHINWQICYLAIPRKIVFTQYKSLFNAIVLYF